MTAMLPSEPLPGAALWSIAPGMPRAHCYDTYQAACEVADSGLLLDGTNLYVSLDDGAHWRFVEHRGTREPASDVPTDFPLAQTPTPTGRPRRGWWRRLRGERDWAPRQGCRLAALLLVVCIPAGLLIAAYCVHLLAASPACAALLAWPARRQLALWVCSCGWANDEHRYVCGNCGGSKR